MNSFSSKSSKNGKNSKNADSKNNDPNLVCVDQMTDDQSVQKPSSFPERAADGTPKSKLTYSNPTVIGVQGKVNYANPQIKFTQPAFKFTKPVLKVIASKVDYFLPEPQEPSKAMCAEIKCTAPTVSVKKPVVYYNKAELKCMPQEIVQAKKDSGSGSKGNRNGSSPRNDIQLPIPIQINEEQATIVQGSGSSTGGQSGSNVE